MTSPSAQVARLGQRQRVRVTFQISADSFSPKASSLPRQTRLFAAGFKRLQIAAHYRGLRALGPDMTNAMS